MNRTQAASRRAQWLSHCLEIGWSKNDLPGLEKIWDSYYDEYGNKIVVEPKEEESQEELWNELADKVPLRMYGERRASMDIFWLKQHFRIERISPPKD